MRDIRLTARRLARRPGFAIFSVVTLALAIGSLSAIYAVADALLLQPIDIRAANEVVDIYHRRLVPGLATHEIALSLPDARDIVGLTDVFSEAVLWTGFRAPLTGEGRFELIAGEAVSGNYFAFTGAAIRRGRPLHPADDALNAPPVAVVSEALAERLQQRGRPDPVGRALMLHGTPFEIVGVVSRRFRGIEMPTLLPALVWVPLAQAHAVRAADAPATWGDRAERWIHVAGRLAPSQRLASAQTALDALSARLDANAPLAAGGGTSRRTRRFAAAPIEDRFAHWSVDFYAVPIAAGVFVAAGLVLLVAVTNLANLLLARGADRRQELAVRGALGASRWQLLREAASEGALLTLAGSAAGLLAAFWLTRALPSQIPAIPGLDIALEPRFSWRLVAVAGVAGLAALVLFALVPAWQTTRAALRGLIDDAHGVRQRHWRGRRLLIAAQVCVSVGVLVPAVMFGRTGWTRAQSDPGFALDALAAAQLDYRYRLDGHARAADVLARVVNRLRKTPEIRDAAVMSALPVYLGTRQYLYVDTAPTAVSSENAATLVRSGRLAHGLTLTTDGLATLGIEVLRGRSFTPSEVDARARTAVVSELVASRLFDATAVLGRTLYVRTTPYAIVGVAADTDTGSVGERDLGTVYLPGMPDLSRPVVIAARGRTPGTPVLRRLEAALREADPDLPVVETLGGAEIVVRQTRFERVAGQLGGWLGAFALVLSLTGASGLIAYAVTSQRREIGIRRALGARDRHIVRLFAMRTAVTGVVGAAAGLGIGAMVAFIASAFLAMDASVTAADVAVAGGSVLVALTLALMGPVRAALRVSPARTLRE